MSRMNSENVSVKVLNALKEGSMNESERYQLRKYTDEYGEFKGQYGVYDIKEDKFVQKGSKNIMQAAVNDYNNKKFEEDEETVETNKTDELKNQLKEIATGKYDSVYDNGSSINVHFHRGDSELYGSIDKENKTTKLTVGSGPNPLDPDFMQLLNELSNILQGYTHNHY